MSGKIPFISVSFIVLGNVVYLPIPYTPPMISVVIPTLNAEATLVRSLTALVGPAMRGLVREVIIVDGGSDDATLVIAEDSGARLLHTAPGRGGQLKAGAKTARGDWLLFLHADTVLDGAWEEETRAFIAGQGAALKAAAFAFALDDYGARAWALERVVGLRCRLLALPYGDQGLLISKQFYNSIGGFTDMPLMEDVDIMRRIGRKRLVLLRSSAVTSAARYRSSGYIIRPLKNLSILTLYACGVPPRLLVKLYG